jgi:D-glycero-D-manno-heptose 1,7-bisphosphate phosphatase
MEQKRRAVFLDRDGTINEEKDYLHRVGDFAFIPGAPEAIRLLRESGFAIIVVTNQSGIGRGYFDEAALDELHRHLDRELSRYGTAVDAYYFCPHHPEHALGAYLTECTCRKPLPGMLQQAVADFGIDPGESYLIGDKLVDVEAGLNAGCRPVLVRTGYGAAHEPRLPEGVPCFDDLLEAARAIVAAAGSTPDRTAT